MPKQSFIGYRFGRLVVTAHAAPARDKHRQVACLCDCGARCVVVLSRLRTGMTRSCGCLVREPRVDLSGQRFGRLLVLSRLIDVADGSLNARFECLCDCGTMAVVRSYDLVSHAARSCGCLRKETTRDRASTHGLSHLPEYHIWMDMRARCGRQTNKAYANYGGRGIRVSPEWNESFECFLRDVGRRPGPEYSLDRIDVNGNYSPGNVRWATKQTQANNTRANRRLTAFGRTKTLSEWARQYSIPVAALGYRINRRGMSLEAALVLLSSECDTAR